MTRTDTLYDVASLTKVVATTPCLLRLKETGFLSLDDSVLEYFPEWGTSSVLRPVSLRLLLTHYSGLCACVPVRVAEQGMCSILAWVREEGIEREPAREFIYSDVNFILLGEIIQRVCGMSLREFSRQAFFSPLGMNDTDFSLSETRRARCAATDGPLGQAPLGVVHDPVARAMGGVAGHAGLFSTAADLVRYAVMLFQHGQFNGRLLLSHESVSEMVRPQSPRCGGEIRALGFDMASRYSSPRGDLFSLSGFGHTGFTGTSLWLDPGRELVICLLTNRTHTGGDVVGLRRTLANIASMVMPPGLMFPARPSVNTRTMTGIDTLAGQDFKGLKGKRVGLLTHSSAVDGFGRKTLDLLVEAKDVHLVRLFAPEHGFSSRREGTIPNGRENPVKGLQTVSLYGQRRRPDREFLEDLDVVLCDLQDVGARFYTYATTMAYCMEEVAHAGLSFWVLDRPNPITGLWPEGPLLDDSLQSFVGWGPLPIRHAMTMGELARFYRHYRSLDLDLKVVSMRGWHRHLWFDETGLPWRDPSPNLRSLNAELLYPGLCLLERTNVSVGRGTHVPFERVGAPWIDGVELSKRINDLFLPGLCCYPVDFTPKVMPQKGMSCHGIHITVTQRDEVRPVRLGVSLAEEILRMHGENLEYGDVDSLAGTSGFMEGLRNGSAQEPWHETWAWDLLAFLDDRMDMLLY